MHAGLINVSDAVLAFTATNFDNLLILVALYTTVGRAGPARWKLVAGEYFGTAVIVGVSVVIALGLFTIPEGWAGVAGFVPIGLGIKGLVQARHAQADGESPPAAAVTSLAGVVLLVVGNGADNVIVYAALFRESGAREIVVYVLAFILMVGLWCLVAALLSTREPVAALIERVGSWLVPMLLIGIGVVIVLSSGLLSHGFSASG